MLQTVAGEILAAAGVVLIAAAAVGILRMPDVYNRINAVAKAAALGVSLVLAGVLVLMPTPVTALVVVLAIAAQLFTAPIAGYSVGRAAYRSGAPLTPTTYRDDLADRPPPPPAPIKD
jgi:multicomponent Na+:H+ antiporter subunit G